MQGHADDKYSLRRVTCSGFEIEESQDADRSNFEIKIDPSFFGLIIGKGGRTIRAIRNLLKVRATIEKKGVNVSVAEKE